MPRSVHVLIASADPDDLPHRPAYEDLRRYSVPGFAQLDLSSPRLGGHEALGQIKFDERLHGIRRSCRAPAAAVFRAWAATGLSRPVSRRRATSHE